MRFGPHTAHVEELLIGLRNPAVRREPDRSGYDHNRPDLNVATYRLVRAAGRLREWDDARMIAAEAAVPSQADDAAAVALAIVASDLIDDAAWDHYMNTPLCSRIKIRRPAGPLAERCACGHQLGQRLVSAIPSPSTGGLAAVVPPCSHTVASLPTPEALEIAFALVQVSDSCDWVELIEAAVLLAG